MTASYTTSRDTTGVIADPVTFSCSTHGQCPSIAQFIAENKEDCSNSVSAQTTKYLWCYIGSGPLLDERLMIAMPGLSRILRYRLSLTIEGKGHADIDITANRLRIWADRLMDLPNYRLSIVKG